MVIKKKSTTATQDQPAASETESQSQEPLNIQRAFDDLEYKLIGKIKQSMPIPDKILTPELQSALKNIAKKFFDIEYDPATFTSIYAAVSKTEQIRLYPPAFKAWGGSVALVWGEEVYPIDPETPCDSISGLKLTKRNSGPVILVDGKGYKAEFRVALRQEYTRGENAVDNWFSSYGEAIEKIGELSDYLQRGERLVKWSEIEPGTELIINELEPMLDRETGTEIAYWVGYTESEGHPFKVYMPGKTESWVNIELDPDLILTKTGESSVSDSLGREHEVGMSFKKMADLEIDRQYIIYEVKESSSGNYGTSYLLLVSPEDKPSERFQVNANTFIKERLQKGVFTPSPDNLGYLKVTSHSKTANGKVMVNCLISTQRDKESENSMADEIAKFAAASAKPKLGGAAAKPKLGGAAAKKVTEPPRPPINYGDIPF